VMRAASSVSATFSAARTATRELMISILFLRHRSVAERRVSCCVLTVVSRVVNGGGLEDTSIARGECFKLLSAIVE
jgi:hypothetical protein